MQTDIDNKNTTINELMIYKNGYDEINKGYILFIIFNYKI
jgi:hypothetical protein